MKKIVFSVLFILSAMKISAQRNVMLIVIDDVGTDWCGFYENHVDTAAFPNISTLLAKGVRFQNAWSAPLCSSTRSGILCGRYSFRRELGNGGGAGHVDSAEVTIPRLLNTYNPNIAKSQIGKFHVEVPTTTNNHLLDPNVMGFDYFAGFLSGALPDYFNWPKVTNGVQTTCTNYATTENINDAVSWIKTQNNKPFFMWLAFNAAHIPYHLPAAGLYTDTTLTGSVQDINKNPKKYFKATLEAIDHEVGRLFDSLQVLNKLDSTDFILIGDNGDSKGSAQIADTSRAKSTIYQNGIHVPFIIAGPSVVNPGRVSSALVNTVDIFATVVELFGYTNWHSQIPLNKTVDSKSIMPIILDTASTIRPWAFTEIFKNYVDSDNGKTIRNMNYKLLNFDIGYQEFYNIANDPDETNDLLKGTLTSTEITNYNYLCSEMTNLTGKGNYCNPTYVVPVVSISTPKNNICVGTNVTFNAIVTNCGLSPTYQWKKNGINVGTNSSSYSSNTLANGNIISCKVTTAALTTVISNQITMTVNNGSPAKPGVISGTQYNLCNTTASYTYSISSVNKATTYIWTVPLNATLVSGQGTTSIIVTYSSLFKSGIMNVQASNDCGSSGNRTLYVYAKTPPPGAINGLNSVCANQQNVSYSIAPVAGSSTYTWTVPTGSIITSGKGTTAIAVKFGSNAGNITVVAKNSCASSALSSLAITINCRMSSDEINIENSLTVINPFTDKINFSVNSDLNNARISLSDLTGREIYQWKNISITGDEQQQLSIDKNIPAGIYLLTIKNSNANLVAKVSHN